MSANNVIGHLLLNLETNRAQFMQEMNQAASHVEKVADRMNKSLGAVGFAVKAFVGGTIFHQMLTEAADAEVAMKKVESVLRSTGGVAGVTAKQVADLADEIESLTGVDGDAVAEAESLLLTFQKIGKDVFPRATRAVVDLSARFDQDLKSSAIQVGKALDRPAEGLSALQRIGVTFTKSQTDLIKALEASGQTLKAQNIILEALETQAGGAASATRDTLGGAMKALETATGNLMEKLGASTGGGLRYAIELVVAGIEMLTAQSGKLEAFFTTAGELTKIWAGWIYQSLKPALNFVLNYFDANTKLIANAVEIARQGYDNLVAIFQGKQVKPFSLAYDMDDILDTFDQDKFAGIEKGLTDFTTMVDQKLATIAANAAKYKGKLLPKPADVAAEGKAVQDAIKQSLADIDKELEAKFFGRTNPRYIAAFNELLKIQQEVKEKAEEDHEKAQKHAADLLTSLQNELEQKAALLANDRDRLAVLEATAEAEKIDNLTKEEKAKLIQDIVERRKQLNEMEDTGKFNEMIKAQERQNEALALQAAGLGDLVDLWQDVKEIQDSVLDPEKQQKYIRQRQEQKEVELQLKRIMEDQKDNLSTIMKSTDSYQQKMDRLTEAVNKGAIQWKDYVAAMKQLNDDQIQKGRQAIENWTKTITNSFTDIITKSKSIKEAMVDLGKTITMDLAQKLLLQPLQTGISQFFGNLFFGQQGQAGQSGGGGNPLFNMLGSLGNLGGWSNQAAGAASQGGFAGGLGKVGQFIAQFMGLGTGFIPPAPGQPAQNANQQGGLQGLPALSSLIANTPQGQAWRVTLVGGAPSAGGTPVITQNPLLGTIPNPMDPLAPLLFGGGAGGGNGLRDPYGTGRTIGGYSLAGRAEADRAMRMDRDVQLSRLRQMDVHPDLKTGWLMNAQGSWDNAINTNARSNNANGYYRPGPGEGANYSSGWGSASNALAIMGMGALAQDPWASQPSFTPGLTGAINKKPMWTPNPYTGPQSQPGPYFHRDANTTVNPVARFVHSLFGYANGGRPSPNIPSLVGEYQPELIIPDRPSSVVPMDVARAIGAQPPQITINTNTSVPVEASVQNSPDGRSATVMIQEMINQAAKSSSFQNVLQQQGNFQPRGYGRG